MKTFLADLIAVSGTRVFLIATYIIIALTQHLSGTPTLALMPTTGCVDAWTATSNVNPPAARRDHTQIWTGKEMIVWGGYDYILQEFLSSGGRYNPTTNDWTPTSTTNAPNPRTDHTAVWTGMEMIVWGGTDNDNFFDDGGRYDPATESWTATSTVGAPLGRIWHTAIWTGTEMIVWGGYDFIHQLPLNTGGRYNPVTNSWVPTSIADAPSPRNRHRAVWTGSEMIVWGGNDHDFGGTDTGGRYNPVTNSWSPTGVVNAPSPRFDHSLVWTGSDMIVWGGSPLSGAFLNTGGIYNPLTDSWSATSTINSPSMRAGHTAIWTGSEVIVWGGLDNGPNRLNTGGRYHPDTNSWAATTTTNAPARRELHAAVWTGNEMVVWGGYNGTTAPLTVGGRYCAEPPKQTPTPSPTPVVTPPGILLINRLSDARAFASHVFGSDNPPPQTQTDFFPADLNNFAQVTGEQGYAEASAGSHSSIVTDLKAGTVQISGHGDSSAGALAFAGSGTGTGSAKLITIHFAIVDGNRSYSLGGKLSAEQHGNSAHSAGVATLTGPGGTIFNVVADQPPAVTLSELGNLAPGEYVFSVDLNATATDFNFFTPGIDPASSSSSGNFDFVLGPEIKTTPTPTVTPSPTPTPTPTPTATLSPSPTPTPSASPSVGMTHALNLSTRMFVQTGDDVGIGGFIITGTNPKHVLLRGIGPSLGGVGVTALADPVLELHGPPGFVTVTNDDWRDPPIFEYGCAPDKGLHPTNDLEACIDVTLAPGAYTAILRGDNDGIGVGLVEIYDLSSASESKLGNLSTRAFVSTGNDIVIAGFILGGGTTAETVLLRGLGPSLIASGGIALANPTLELRNSDGAVIATNDDWQTGPAVSLPPTDPLESAIEMPLAPGAYTALLSGVESGTGVALVEIYDVGSP